MNDRIFVLIGKKRAGEATVEELQELVHLMAEYDLSGYTNEVMDKVWEARFEEISDNHLGKENWIKIQQRIKHPARIFILSPRKKWLVASCVLLVGCSLLFCLQLFKKQYHSGELIANNKVSQFITQPGSKSKLHLPDGTEVWLNGNSKLTYAGERFGKHIREVYLSGEAFFEVTKNEKIPFIVHAGSINITVKGTAFNVKCYLGQKTIETSLVRGLIEITTLRDPDRRIIVKPNEKIIVPAEVYHEIKKDDSSRSDYKPVYAISSLHKGKSDVLPEMVWMQTRLEFDNEPFEELIPQMETWFNIKIHVLYEGIRTKRFSGVIEKETLKETLAAMQLSCHFDYELNGNDLIISKKK